MFSFLFLKVASTAYVGTNVHNRKSTLGPLPSQNVNFRFATPRQSEIGRISSTGCNRQACFAVEKTNRVHRENIERVSRSPRFIAAHSFFSLLLPHHRRCFSRNFSPSLFLLFVLRRPRSSIRQRKKPPIFARSVEFKVRQGDLWSVKQFVDLSLKRRLQQRGGKSCWHIRGERITRRCLRTIVQSIFSKKKWREIFVDFVRFSSIFINFYHTQWLIFFSKISSERRLNYWFCEFMCLVIIAQ